MGASVAVNLAFILILLNQFYKWFRLIDGKLELKHVLRMSLIMGPLGTYLRWKPSKNKIPINLNSVF